MCTTYTRLGCLLVGLGLLLTASHGVPLPNEEISDEFRNRKYGNEVAAEEEESAVRQLDAIGRNNRLRLKEKIHDNQHTDYVNSLANPLEQNMIEVYLKRRRNQEHNFYKYFHTLHLGSSNTEKDISVRALDGIGGGNLVRALDGIGGGNLVRALDGIGGGNLVRSLDGIGGGNLVRALDGIGGGNLVRALDGIGGGNLVRSLDSFESKILEQYIRKLMLEEKTRNRPSSSAHYSHANNINTN